MRSWPKSAIAVKVFSNQSLTLPKLAIVMQGPLDERDDFTLETIRLYKNNFPRAVVILSVFTDSSDGYLDKIRSEGVEVVLNEKPTNLGPFNINMQISSAFAGVKKAREKGAEYVIKTRNDQRIYGPNTYQFLLNLLKIFPVKKGFLQKDRIISTSVFSLKYYPYVISDMTVFGRTKDMMIYWGADLNNKPQGPDIVFGDPHLGRETVKLNPGGGEVYLVTEFLKNIKRDFRWSLDDYWQVLADHFCVIDYQSLDIYWHKRERHYYEENKFVRYDKDKIRQSLSFREWLNIYHLHH